MSYVERAAADDSEFIGIEPDFDNPQSRLDCPLHACDCPDDHRWGNCPVAVEGDPPEVKTCGYMAEELTLRMHDIQRGNYVEWIAPGHERHPGNGDKRHYVQHYVQGVAVGDIELLSADEPFDGYCVECNEDCVFCSHVAVCDCAGAVCSSESFM